MSRPKSFCDMKIVFLIHVAKMSFSWNYICMHRICGCTSDIFLKTFFEIFNVFFHSGSISTSTSQSGFPVYDGAILAMPRVLIVGSNDKWKKLIFSYLREGILLT
jgi:hypothetical protein